MQTIQIIQGNTIPISTIAKVQEVVNGIETETVRDLTGFDVYMKLVRKNRRDLVLQKDSDSFSSDGKIDFILESEDTKDLGVGEYFLEIKGKKQNVVFTAFQIKVQIALSYINI